MPRSLSPRIVVAGLAWVGLSAGCGQVLGTAEYRTARPVDDEGSGGAGGEAPEVDACFACVETSCAEAIDNCLGNPSCAPGYPCIYQCTDPDCVRRCASEELSLQEAFAGNLLADIDDCVLDRCSEACELPNGNWACVDGYDFASMYQVGDRLDLAVTVADPQVAPPGYRGFFKVTDPTGADPFTYIHRTDAPIFDHGLHQGALFADPTGLALTFVLSKAGLSELPDGAGMILFRSIWDCRMWDLAKPGLEVTVEPMADDTYIFPLDTPSWTTPPSAMGIIAPAGDVTITLSYEGKVVRRMDRRLETNVVESWTHVFPQWSGSI